LKYLHLGIDSYLSSFRQYDPAMSYICLCIAMETLSTSRSEVTHKIARTCAVLNASDKVEGSTIEFNVKQFYDLRSTIVHGGNYELSKLVEYYSNLRALISRTFLELICLNIQSKEMLNELISQYGYGDKGKLKSDYRPVAINTSVQDLIKVKVKRHDNRH
jgi:hypothetical protein